MKVQFRDMNYLEEFKDIEVDNLISPLHLASFTGKVEIVKLLLENETIDLDLPTKDSGFTAASIACATGNYEILRLLIENGADVNKENNFNQPPLFYCFTRLQEDTNVFENQLICMKMADSLLQNGANIDYIVDKKKNYTLLMQFCSLKLELNQREKDTNVKVITFLLEKCANRNLKSKKGRTAFELAQKHCNKNEIQRLLKTVQNIAYQTESTSRSFTSSTYKVSKKKGLITEENSFFGGSCDIFKWFKKS